MPAATGESVEPGTISQYNTYDSSKLIQMKRQGLSDQKVALINEILARRDAGAAPLNPTSKEVLARYYESVYAGPKYEFAQNAKGQTARFVSGSNVGVIVDSSGKPIGSTSRETFKPVGSSSASSSGEKPRFYGSVSAAPKPNPNKPLDVLQSFLSQERSKIRTESERSGNEPNVLRGIKGFGLGIASSFTGTLQFSKSLLTEPGETIKSIPGGVKQTYSFLSSGQATQTLKAEPGFTSGFIVGEVATTKAFGEAGKLISKGYGKIRTALETSVKTEVPSELLKESVQPFTRQRSTIILKESKTGRYILGTDEGNLGISIGGGIEKGQTARKAALMELRQETGLGIDDISNFKFREKIVFPEETHFVFSGEISDISKLKAGSDIQRFFSISPESAKGITGQTKFNPIYKKVFSGKIFKPSKEFKGAMFENVRSYELGIINRLEFGEVPTWLSVTTKEGKFFLGIQSRYNVPFSSQSKYLKEDFLNLAHGTPDIAALKKFYTFNKEFPIDPLKTQRGSVKGLYVQPPISTKNLGLTQKKILDLGSGKRLYPGTDIGVDFLYGRKNVPNKYGVVKSDYNIQIPFSEGYFKKIKSSFSLDVFGTSKAYKESYRVLSPGGKIEIISGNSISHLNKIVKKIKEAGFQDIIIKESNVRIYDALMQVRDTQQVKIVTASKSSVGGEGYFGLSYAQVGFDLEKEGIRFALRQPKKAFYTLREAPKYPISPTPKTFAGIESELIIEKGIIRTKGTAQKIFVAGERLYIQPAQLVRNPTLSRYLSQLAGSPDNFKTLRNLRRGTGVDYRSISYRYVTPKAILSGVSVEILRYSKGGISRRYGRGSIIRQLGYGRRPFTIPEYRIPTPESRKSVPAENFKYEATSYNLKYKSPPPPKEPGYGVPLVPKLPIPKSSMRQFLPFVEKKKISTKLFPQPKRYQPTLSAAALGIKALKIPKAYTLGAGGIIQRPLISRRRRR